ncbi:hypothetical protein EC973_004477 [Apophysomyces ossiformis]|uniref:Uncharacterized protein n=1 Tax=Apophysomyces ossiformis TaxID=679940 RepID=A0A8H7BFX3_9FUNG|nr:hypothetical protein EC973_004477 [Apophysomyces ossiformis]
MSTNTTNSPTLENTMVPVPTKVESPLAITDNSSVLSEPMEDIEMSSEEENPVKTVKNQAIQETASVI